MPRTQKFGLIGERGAITLREFAPNREQALKRGIVQQLVKQTHPVDALLGFGHIKRRERFPSRQMNRECFAGDANWCGERGEVDYVGIYVG